MLISSNTGLYSAREGKTRFPMTETIDFLAGAGFEAVDVNFAAVIYPEAEKHEDILDGAWQNKLDAVKEKIARHHLTVSHTHLPFYDYCLSEKETLERNTAYMYRAIEASAYVGAHLAVIHPQRNAQRQTLVEDTISLLTPFNEAAKKAGVTLCVENMASTSAEELCAIVDGLSCAACWDCGHANLGHFDQYQSVKTLGKRLQVLHLHDNYGTKDDHSLPYLGTVDWAGLLQGLTEMHYPGTFNYEVAAKKVPEVLRADHAKYMVDAARYMLGRT